MAENHMMGYSKRCRGNKLYPNTPCNAQKLQTQEEVKSKREMCKKNTAHAKEK